MLSPPLSIIHVVREHVEMRVSLLGANHIVTVCELAIQCGAITLCLGHIIMASRINFSSKTKFGTNGAVGGMISSGLHFRMSLMPICEKALAIINGVERLMV